jgi:glucosyl-dolichyl phosphate glucuronosyltransferase
MFITVAICTWNRAKLLDLTLAQICKMRVPEGIEWELFVVNNNCTDDTRQVIDSYLNRLPLRPLFETKQGLSNARNCAIDAANGDWVVYTDDDVLVSEDWLAAYAATMATVADNCVFLGGPIRPWFEKTPSDELSSAIPTVANGFCGIEVAADEQILDENQEVPLGANFAIRRSCLNVLRFRTDLGLVAGKRIAGEETALLRELLRQGFSGMWVAEASVSHFVPKERIALSYLKRHLFDLGRTGIRTGNYPSGTRRIRGIPTWVYRQVIESFALGVIASCVLRKRMFYEHFSKVCIYSGMIRESFCALRSDVGHSATASAAQHLNHSRAVTNADARIISRS